MLINPALGRLRQEDCEFMASLGYMPSLLKPKEKEKRKGRKEGHIWPHRPHITLSLELNSYSI
jgi:hypothetical protein